ncbi:MAG TPA: bifunctional phosphopantothenoylcysteine decarboxylase/phosphopantothenate--cysteine ligase CoaBC [Thermosynergistes sp.]|nr:bifunctional phosphopantothenoylcysteine decarboxylase/phosphopantothenate--cysteine ligase CoaBC [Thermosynergistes sp.]HPZ75356.1 bifunctional phosphopantothenoylcysteine decarboxylase/phosphopantothenate--cysteine ligase CoaBC [Thermosynergistes sp.]
MTALWKSNRRVLFGISGGISAYKAPQIVRALRSYNCEVEIILTEAAEKFVAPLVLSTLAERKVWRQSDFLNPEEGWKIPHIKLADWAEVAVVAPATANVLRRAALGEAETLLGAALLATRAPVLIFPAMNVHMWEHEATQEHVGRLQELGYFVFEPEEGELACGYEGKGRLPSVDVILEEIWRSLCPKKDLKGKHVLVTAGPTWEFIDPVRFLSNPSSGKMGYAMARTAWYRGAEVVLVSGPVGLPQPHWAHLVSATSAEEMGRAVMEHLSWADVIVKAAAVSDFRAEERKSQKIKRQGRDKLDLQLVQNPDIAAAVGLNKRQDQLLIGFAAESEDLLENARSKMARKGLDMIVVNDITVPGAGFTSDTNVVKVLDPKGVIAELKGSKEAVADAIWEIATTRLPSAR